VELLSRILGLEVRPSAVATCSEPVVTGLYLALAQAGMAPGRDLSVIGFRDNPQRRYLSPPPACFELALDMLGSALAEAVVATATQAPSHDSEPLRVVWPMRFRETPSISPV
jgi:DNA-binding LacI/PurR family transcriptional regulator